MPQPVWENSLRLLLQSQRKNSVTNLRKRTARSWVHRKAWIRSVVLANKAIPTHVYDGSLVMGNLMNAAESLGVANIWIHRAKEEFESDFGKNIFADLGIEGEYEGIGHCAFGYAVEPAKKAAPRKEDYVYYIR